MTTNANFLYFHANPLNESSTMGRKSIFVSIVPQTFLPASIFFCTALYTYVATPRHGVPNIFKWSDSSLLSAALRRYSIKLSFAPLCVGSSALQDSNIPECARGQVCFPFTKIIRLKIPISIIIILFRWRGYDFIFELVSLPGEQTEQSKLRHLSK